MPKKVSRRDFLRTGAALGAGLALPQLAQAQEAAIQPPPTT